MDRARQRFNANLRLLTGYNQRLAVMGDREWVNDCANDFIQRMARKMWLYYLTPREVDQVNRAVEGWLTVIELREKANPVQAGIHMVKGKVLSARPTCDHLDCRRHWKMNVRDENEHYAIYTPIPEEWLEGREPAQLIGLTVSYVAYLTSSDRDPSFGFAHRPKLMTIYEEKQNAS